MIKYTPEMERGGWWVPALSCRDDGRWEEFLDTSFLLLLWPYLTRQDVTRCGPCVSITPATRNTVEIDVFLDFLQDTISLDKIGSYPWKSTCRRRGVRVRLQLPEKRCLEWPWAVPHSLNRPGISTSPHEWFLSWPWLGAVCCLWVPSSGRALVQMWLPQCLLLPSFGLQCFLGEREMEHQWERLTFPRRRSSHLPG